MVVASACNCKATSSPSPHPQASPSRQLPPSSSSAPLLSWPLAPPSVAPPPSIGCNCKFLVLGCFKDVLNLRCHKLHSYQLDLIIQIPQIINLYYILIFQNSVSFNGRKQILSVIYSFLFISIYFVSYFTCEFDRILMQTCKVYISEMLYITRVCFTSIQHTIFVRLCSARTNARGSFLPPLRRRWTSSRAHPPPPLPPPLPNFLLVLQKKLFLVICEL